MFWSMHIGIECSSAWHSHEVFELIFCLAGTGQLEVEGSVIDLQPQRLMLVAPYARHRYFIQNQQHADIKVVCITQQDSALYLSPIQAERLNDLRSQRYAYADLPPDAAALAELTQQIPEGSVGGNRQEELRVWAVVGMLLALQTGQGGKEASHGLGSGNRAKMHEICSWLDGHLNEKLSLDQLAMQFALSRSLLTRSFRNYTGSSVLDYVNARRMETSARLLTSCQEKDIAQIATESGFLNLSNFHRRFKAAYGMTPAEFRKNFSR